MKPYYLSLVESTLVVDRSRPAPPRAGAGARGRGVPQRAQPARRRRPRRRSSRATSNAARSPNVQSLMSLLEGHGNSVMNQLGREHVAGQARMARVLHARRQSAGMAAFLQKLVGPRVEDAPVRSGGGVRRRGRARSRTRAASTPPGGARSSSRRSTSSAAPPTGSPGSTARRDLQLPLHRRWICSRRWREPFRAAVDGIGARRSSWPVPGGADSVALLALAVDAGLAPVAVHVDHALRDGSEREADGVAALAASLGAEFRAARAPVEPRAEPGSAGTRRSLRRARASPRRRVGAELRPRRSHRRRPGRDGVARTCCAAQRRRGSRAWHPATGAIVRPLLGLPARRDPARSVRRSGSTCSRSHERRRHLPAGRDPSRCAADPLGVSPARDLVPVLARQADILRAESDYLDELAVTRLARRRSTARAACSRRSPPLARRAVRRWLGAPPPSADEVERVLAVAAGKRRATELAGGRVVRRSAGRLDPRRSFRVRGR